MDEKKHHKILERQLRKKFGKNYIPSQEMQELLLTISETYQDFERDRSMLERAMEISSNELRISYEQKIVQQEIERKNEQLEQFVQSVSHDLKAPIQTISSFGKVLNKELQNFDLPVKVSKSLDFILNATEGIGNLVTNLLEYTKVKGDQIPLEETDLNLTLDLVHKNLYGLLEENQGKLIIGALPIINAVPHQMVQLFQNLIGNALKFKRKGVPPIVKVNCEENVDHFVFSVADNGIGMSKEGKEKIFKAFQRLNNSNQFKGTGLGLSISKAIIEKIDGKISVESEPGVGSTFIIQVPKETVQENPISQKSLAKTP